jgi:hypothetical protein
VIVTVTAGTLIVTPAVADLVVSWTLVAVTWNGPTVCPAVKTPLELIVPPVAVQVTAVLLAPVTVAVNCFVPPRANDAVEGVTVTDTTGAVTVTVVVADMEPMELVAVKVYVVVAVGLTVTDPPLTDPGAGLMLSAVAPETDQINVTGCPDCVVDGDALKFPITGADGVPIPTPKRPNWSAGSPLPMAPILPP